MEKNSFQIVRCLGTEIHKAFIQCIDSSKHDSKSTNQLDGLFSLEVWERRYGIRHCKSNLRSLIPKDRVLLSGTEDYLKIQQWYRYCLLSIAFNPDPLYNISVSVEMLKPEEIWGIFHEKEARETLSRITKLTQPYYEKYARWLPFEAFASLIRYKLEFGISCCRDKSSSLKEISEFKAQEIIRIIDFFHQHDFFIKSLGSKLNGTVARILDYLKELCSSDGRFPDDRERTDGLEFLRF